jgi:hypothetical protein
MFDPNFLLFVAAANGFHHGLLARPCIDHDHVSIVYLSRVVLKFPITPLGASLLIGCLIPGNTAVHFPQQQSWLSMSAHLGNSLDYLDPLLVLDRQDCHRFHADIIAVPVLTRQNHVATTHVVFFLTVGEDSSKSQVGHLL